MINEKERIERLRNAINCSDDTIAKLAREVDTSKQNLWNFATGKTNTMMGFTLTKLEKRLGVNN
jgi:transcriptional regulator with XRE-family HTH domain